MGGAAQQGRANSISWACLGGSGPLGCRGWMWRAAEKPACPQTSLGAPAAESKGKGRGRSGRGRKLGVEYRVWLCPSLTVWPRVRHLHPLSTSFLSFNSGGFGDKNNSIHPTEGCGEQRGPGRGEHLVNCRGQGMGWLLTNVWIKAVFSGYAHQRSRHNART